MPSHPIRFRAGQAREELHPAAVRSIPFLIFAAGLFVVYQVNHHSTLEGMITSTQQLHEDQHFVTGGRRQQERNLRLGAADKSGSTLQASASPTSLSLTSGSTTGSTVTDSTTLDDAAIDAKTGLPVVCHAEHHAEYHGDVVQWGDSHVVASAGECCAACQRRAADGCNVWVYCDQHNCGDSSHPRPRGECWLKKAPLDDVLQNHVGKGHSGIPWMSGVVYTARDWAAHQQRAAAAVKAEEARLQALRDNASLPLVWMDVNVKGQPVGRMEFVLFTHISPLAAENLRRMMTGEVSTKHTLKGVAFYRIIDRFIDQTGVDIQPCALGGMFKDDPAGLLLKHDRKGLLSVANMGHDTNTGHFSILMGPAPHLNGNYVIFGELVSGWQVAEAINVMSRGRPNNELLHSRDALITDCGQIRRGTPVSEELIQAGLVDHRSA